MAILPCHIKESKSNKLVVNRKPLTLSAPILSSLRHLPVLTKVLALNFDNNSALLIKGALRQEVSIKAIHELSAVPPFKNTTPYFLNSLSANIKYTSEIIKDLGPIANRLDFFTKNKMITHLFIDQESKKKELDHLYGYNSMHWDEIAQTIEISACNADPFEEELINQLGQDRLKGIGLYTVAQACCYYNKLVPNARSKDVAIHLQSTPFAFRHKVWQRYGFKLFEQQYSFSKYQDNLKNQNQHLFLTAGGVQKFLAKYP